MAAATYAVEPLARVLGGAAASRALDAQGRFDETYPVVTQIEFVNAERTKANASVTIGYSGATVVLEKVDGTWRAVRLANQWIT